MENFFQSLSQALTDQRFSKLFWTFPIAIITVLIYFFRPMEMIRFMEWKKARRLETYGAVIARLTLDRRQIEDDKVKMSSTTPTCNG
mmetsp:Transcript_52385/g.126789  ORF Transcript_52385/g.126789 Transcript_52385/m.126789 type:complete len:87 (-) Transcript_52385:2198-2458(-)